jgi:hypothetical protein
MSIYELPYTENHDWQEVYIRQVTHYEKHPLGTILIQVKYSPVMQIATVNLTIDKYASDNEVSLRRLFDVYSHNSIDKICVAVAIEFAVDLYRKLSEMTDPIEFDDYQQRVNYVRGLLF